MRGAVLANWLLGAFGNRESPHPIKTKNDGNAVCFSSIPAHGLF